MLISIYPSDMSYPTPVKRHIASKESSFYHSIKTQHLHNKEMEGNIQIFVKKNAGQSSTVIE